MELALAADIPPSDESRNPKACGHPDSSSCDHDWDDQGACANEKQVGYDPDDNAATCGQSQRERKVPPPHLQQAPEHSV
jgi:hypothetical protein